MLLPLSPELVPVFAGGGVASDAVVVAGGLATSFEAVSVFENEPATAKATKKAATRASGTT
ncbi:MAG: hypothetical protein Q7T86_06825 [Hyphomicrobiaceae bacterium]|nr:hypothetical protein [Hyphomicrobiaceae bacterium]